MFRTTKIRVSWCPRIRSTGTYHTQLQKCLPNVILSAFLMPVPSAECKVHTRMDSYRCRFGHKANRQWHHTNTFALGPLIGRHFNQKLSSFGVCVSQSGWTLDVGRGTHKAVRDRHCSTACNTLGNHISAFCILQCRQRTNVAAKHLYLGRCVCANELRLEY